ncbi:ABC transporter ATP-binding protein [Nocardia cyriacigeorgica]|uniref:ABC transporter ATP-binding protein n=1 Tax=Nocardia cyriacigeorgica TaxID=135487 RepID=A0A6P1D579_9NOCA|nr:ABC transporter ATP-binding protein [Nocardia cyriacigeorgica]NEW44699.1 ABC transporter ATP-binding protein [Nocardia cyriacigeorgica]
MTITETAAVTTSAARITGLGKSFGGNTVLDGIDVDIEAGAIVALVGRSGSGKSTLLRIIGGLERPDRGAVTVDAQPTIVFQEARLIPWLPVVRNVALGRPRPHNRRDDETIARELLEQVDLRERADAWPLTLSGGEAQRVALARALVAHPTLLLLDEPFGALDALTRLVMHDLLLRLHAERGFGVLLVTHDVGEAVALADRVLVLDNGRIAEEVSVDLPRPRAHSSPRAADFVTRLLALLGVAD